MAIIDSKNKIIRLKIGFTTRSIWDRLKEVSGECKKENILNRKDIRLKVLDVFRCIK
jgi:hypothetical protein